MDNSGSKINSICALRKNSVFFHIYRILFIQIGTWSTNFSRNVTSPEMFVRNQK